MQKSHYGFFIIILFAVLSCNNKNTRQKDVALIETKVDVMYRMKLPNSSKVIYTYTDFGKYAFSNWRSGKIILDSTEVFNVNVDNEIPFYLVGIDAESNKIKGIELIDLEESTEKGIYDTEINGLIFRVKKYRYKKRSELGLFYTYRTFTETQDSISFEGIKVDGFAIALPDKMVFKKGIITANEDSLGFVTNFELKIFNEYPLWKMMRENPKKIDLRNQDNKFTAESQLDLDPFSIIYPYTIILKPDSLGERQKQKISDYGIYKRVK